MNVQQQINLEKTLIDLFDNQYCSIAEVAESLSQIIIGKSYFIRSSDTAKCYRVIASEISKISKFCEDLSL